MIEIPQSPADVSLDWLNSSLAVSRGSDREIVAFEMSEPLQGQSSVTRRIQVTWADGDRASFFLKMLDPVAPFVDLHLEMGVYRTEIGFYKNIREAGLRIPECYVAEVDPDTQAFVLLLEDVGPGRSLESLDDAELAIASLARFHGRWWKDERLRDERWLGTARERCLKVMPAAKAALATVEREPELRPLLDNEAREALRLLFTKSAGWADHRQHASLTLCHGDYHPGQMFFPTDRNEFVVYDWQFALFGSGAVDLVFFLSTALTESQYQSHGQCLIEMYFNILLESVPEYRSIEFSSDLGHAAVFVLIARLIAFLNANLDDAVAARVERGSDWRERITYPSLIAIDLGGYDAVRKAVG